MTLSALDHPNLIVIHYWPYQGGKFFANCLAHHPKVLPQLPILDTDHWVFSNTADVDLLKINTIYSSIPPLDKTHEWHRYELGCRNFWGGNIANFSSQQLVPDPAALLLLDQYRCFIMSHVPTAHMVDCIQQQLPQAKHIVLTNAHRFTKIAMSIKQPSILWQEWMERNQLSQDHYNTKIESIADSVFVVDVDQVYFDRSSVNLEVNRCLSWLGLDNNLSPALDDFLSLYFSRHGI